MLTVALLASALVALAAGRVYERCELARDLLALGVNREHVATWVCIAYHESRFDTAAQNFGSGDHGLLQISELYWCGPGKACGAPCSAFRDDDISDDVRCALQIYDEHTRLQGNGFLAWVVYPHYCKQNAKKFIVDCDKNIYKNIPVKFEDRARSFKPYDIKSESKPRVINNPYRNPVTPRYLSINSIFQGDFVNEFERNYYDNFKQSNWLNFKVDDIDVLEIPVAVSEDQRPRHLELTTRLTPVTTVDPDLIGIKPPSPRKIETNQFRRRKTFSQSMFLQNSIKGDRDKNPTTAAPVRNTSEPSLSFNGDISHNIFLNSQASKEFSSPEIKSTDLSPYLRHQVKNPRKEEISPAITVNDLAQNPFLNSIFRSNFQTRTESTPRYASFVQNNYRGYALTTSRPEVSFRSSKEIGFLRNSEVNSNVPESSKSRFSQTFEDTEVHIADLAQNPFLSRIFRVNTVEQSTGAYENYKEFVTQTTAKPRTTHSVFKYPSTENNTARQVYLETSTKRPQKLMRGRARYLTDKTTTESPTSESSTMVTYSTRRYHTINRQKTTTNKDNFKSTRAIESITEKPSVSMTLTTQTTVSSASPTQSSISAVEPTQSTVSSTEPTRPTVFSTSPTQLFTSASKKKIFEIETTTSKTTTTLSTTIHNVTEINKFGMIPIQSTSRTEITSEKPTTKLPEITTRANLIRRPVSNNTETANVTHRTPATTRKLQTVTRTDGTSRSQAQLNTTTVSTKHTYTTSRSQETSSLLSTSRTESLRRSDRKLETYSRQATTSTTRSTREPHKTSEPNANASRSPTTPRSWSYRRFKEEQHNTSTTTTPRPSYNYLWKRPAIQLNSTTVYSNTTDNSMTTTTKSSTGKTTQSIFDLYLKPSTRPPFKLFEVTSSGRPRKGISIFFGGTTKPPPNYYNHKKSTTEELRGTDT